MSWLARALAGYLAVGLVLAALTWVAWWWADRQDDRPIAQAQIRERIHNVPGGMRTLLVTMVIAWPAVVVNYVKGRGKR